MKTRNIIIFFAAGVLLVFILMGYGIYVNRASSIHVDRMIAVQNVSVTGARAEYQYIYPMLYFRQFQIKYTWTADIIARFEAILDELYVKEGDYVIAGQPLASLVSDDLNFQILQAQSNIRETEASLIDFEQNYARYEFLFSQGAISKQQFENVENSIIAIKARIESQTAAYDQIVNRKKQGLLTAPHDGQIIRVYQQNGAFVQTGSPIMLISDTKELALETVIPAEDISPDFFQDNYFKLSSVDFTNTLHGKTSIGLDKDTSDFAESYDLVLEKIDPPLHISASLRSVTWKFINDKNNLIMPGVYHFGRAYATSSAIMLAIPKAAVFNDNYVYVVNQKNKLEMRKIKTGIGDDTYIQVLDGLEKDDIVVVSSKAGLGPGISVKVFW